MNNTMQEPKPTAKRYRTQELVHVEICGRHDKIFCKLENLSTTGSSLKILSAKIMPRIKDVIKIVVDLKSLNKTHVKYAEIVWINGLDLGVVFVAAENAQKRIIFSSNRA
jgi:PilZ domain